MTTTAWDKFLLLSWKNWLIQFRHPVQTALEVLIPILVCAFLVLIRALVDVNEQKEALVFENILIDNRFHNEAIMSMNTTNRIICYSPTNPILDDIISNIVNDIPPFTYQSFPDALTLEGNAINSNPFVSIEFDQALASITSLPDDIAYALRFPAELRTDNEALAQMGGFTNNWATNIRFGLDFLPGPRNGDINHGGEPPGYIVVSGKALNFEGK
jgi:ATP-binding cassette subfamily A (ABC1) protein 3